MSPATGMSDPRRVVGTQGRRAFQPTILRGLGSELDATLTASHRTDSGIGTMTALSPLSIRHAANPLTAPDTDFAPPTSAANRTMVSNLMIALARWYAGPTCPGSEKRPADVICVAVTVMQIATR
jgi:hypothetical protein